MVKKLALLDWDGTLRKGFTIKTWVAFLVKENILNHRIEDALQNLFDDYKKGNLTHDDLSQETAELYASALKNFRHQDILRAASEFLAEDRAFLSSFLMPLITFLKNHDIATAVISGAPVEVIGAYQKELQIDEVFAFECEVINGIYSGNIKVNIGTSVEKDRVISFLAKTQKYNFYLAMGNANSDLPLFRVATNNIIVNNANLESFILSRSYPIPRILHMDEEDDFTAIAKFLMENKAV